MARRGPHRRDQLVLFEQIAVLLRAGHSANRIQVIVGARRSTVQGAVRTLRAFGAEPHCNRTAAAPTSRFPNSQSDPGDDDLDEVGS